MGLDHLQHLPADLNRANPEVFLAILGINLDLANRHALIAALGGLPLIHMGDELGLANDGSYRDDPDRAGDGSGCSAREWIGR